MRYSAIIRSSHSKSNRKRVEIGIRKEPSRKGVTFKRYQAKQSVKGASLTVNRSPHGNKTARDQFELPVWKRERKFSKVEYLLPLLDFVTHNKWNSNEISVSCISSK